MGADLDHGPGAEDEFPAEDLERLYRLGGLDVAQNIQGSSLNRVLGVDRYEPQTWYVVTREGVKRL
jgi:hypothetical protein